MDRVVEIFKEISKIPHCSSSTIKLKEYIKEFAYRCGYKVAEDKAGNIAAYSPNGKATVQSHYDMVCIGEAPNIEIVTENGYIRAKNSSLGADNGIGVAIMLYMMEKGLSADFLFTNDEEIGLIGALNLALDIKTKNLLNLDSEELGKVYIGCAGGEDIFLKKSVDTFKVSKKGRYYILEALTPGGHSGVNIADGIPNAITEIASVIYENKGMEVVSFYGGERINTIAKSAKAIVYFKDARAISLNNSFVKATLLDDFSDMPLKEGRDIVAAIFGFAHGVRGWNKKLDLPQSSINLAKVKVEKEGVEIALSARAMSNEDLNRLVNQTIAEWEALGFTYKREGKYPAWSPRESRFSKRVLQLYKNRVKDAGYAAIHAGLECAIFADRFKSLDIVSIGPNILEPHSDRERVEIKSVEVVANLVTDIILDLS